MDLAEAVDDLICALDGSGDTTMDTLAMFLFGWILVALFVLWLGRFLYERFVVARSKQKASSTTALTNTTSGAVLAGSSDVLDAAKKQQPVIAPKAAGAFVPPTPPVRRRLTRQSPAPEARKARYVPAPQATGPDNVVVLWVNDVFQWLYNDLVIVNELLQVWIHSLNDYTKKSVTEQGIGVELVRILPETHPPTLTNIFVEADSKDDVSITCDCDATPAFQLKSFRQKGEKVDTSHYRVDLNRFRARLNIYCVSEKLQANIKCDGWPEIKVALAPVGNIKNNLDETQLQEVITEIVTTALRNTEVNLNLAQYPTCPRLIRHIETPGRMLPLHYDSMQGNAYSSTPNHSPLNAVQLQGEKRLLVKVIRAAQLGGTQGCVEPFCVIEMDEPSQKNQTSVQKNTDSPYWDEHFLFDLSPHTAELLFEVYDHAVRPHRFLGLGIVGVEELLINPSQRQIISLQSRPYESDPVTGTLTVEFLFIEGADIPNVGSNQPFKIKETIRTPSPSRARLSTTTTTYLNDNLTNGNHVLNSALTDLERNRQFGSPNKSTLVIHSVQRQPSQRFVKLELENGDWKEVERLEINPSQNLIDAEKQNVEVKVDGDKLKEKLTELHANGNSSKTEGIQENGVPVTAETNGGANGDTSTKENVSDLESSGKAGDFSATTTLQSQSTSDYEYRGRPRKRRDFFGTIKRRLGKSKNRSKSAGPENDIGRDDSLNRSVSADRGRNDHYLNPPGREENSRRSSLSEASGLSSASTRTYINEASTLVLETIENGIKKHYLVPLSLAQKSKWKKKGVKLHIFNDHTFVAKHLQGGTICQVCAKSIARRFGKQGYECRDCFLKCHKHCHVKVNDNCPTSTIHNIELSYIQNPYTDKNLSLL
ncbi:uncharacterized protein LOC115881827 isoform X3 [Sitophilus oryzae]|uniref:Uncharacterized protein LOC115881827 isoform X3 n=1 Tax=Sitophilus oryzae TaxID=7048 RepID=A0A6J2XXI4_SITOR|nr:uncharacterized protein LOC115881827 isoform X3 [Sitophilus oryzae]